MPTTECRRLVDAIRELNPSAASDWLLEFDETELRNYLCRLELAADRGPSARGWIRPAGAPPAVSRRPAA